MRRLSLIELAQLVADAYAWQRRNFSESPVLPGFFMRFETCAKLIFERSDHIPT
jgi:hypothetical protein